MHVYTNVPFKSCRRLKCWDQKLRIKLRDLLHLANQKTHELIYFFHENVVDSPHRGLQMTLTKTSWVAIKVISSSDISERADKKLLF